MTFGIRSSQKTIIAMLTRSFSVAIVFSLYSTNVARTRGYRIVFKAMEVFALW